MGARNQPSSIDRLPPDTVAEINRLRQQHGWTIDQLVDFVRGKGESVTRSAMGRHVRSLHLDVEAAADKINRARAISEALIERFGDKPDNELARLNIQMLHGQIFNMILEDETASDDDGNPLPADPLRTVRLSKSIQQLLSAEKMNAERVKEIRKMAIEEERERASAALDSAADRGELRREALIEAKRIMGYE